MVFFFIIIASNILIGTRLNYFFLIKTKPASSVRYYICLPKSWLVVAKASVARVAELIIKNRQLIFIFLIYFYSVRQYLLKLVGLVTASVVALALLMQGRQRQRYYASKQKISVACEARLLLKLKIFKRKKKNFVLAIVAQLLG